MSFLSDIFGGINTSTVTNSPPQQVLDNYQNVFNQATNVAGLNGGNYPGYSGQLVAPLNGGQRTAIGQLQGVYGTQAPFINAGAGYLGNAASGLGNVQNYLTAGSQAGANASNYAGNAWDQYAASSGYAGSSGNALQGMSPYMGQVASGIGAAQNTYGNALDALGSVGNYVNSGTGALGQMTSGLGAVGGYLNSANGALGQQNAALGQVGGYLGSASGAAGAAMGSFGQAESYAAPVAFSQAALQQYENPYTQDVINSTTDWMNQNNHVQATQLASNEIGSGAYGGDRGGIAQAALAGQQDLANQSTISGLYNQNYEQAVNQFNQEQADRFQAANIYDTTGQGQLGAASAYNSMANTQLGVAQGYGQNAAGYNQAAGTQLSTALGYGQAAQGYNNFANTQLATAGQYGGIASGQLQSALGYNSLAQDQGQMAQQYGNLGTLANQTGAGYSGLGSLALQQGGLYGTLGQLQGTTGQAQGQLAGMAGYLGSQAVNTGIQGASAGLQGSTLAQQTQQQQDTAAYQQYMEALGYPFQTTGWLSNIAQGLGSASGGTSSTSGNLLSSVGGLGVTGLGVLGATGAFGSSGYLTGASGLLSGLATGGRVDGTADRNGYARGGTVAAFSGLGGIPALAHKGLGAGLGGVNVMRGAPHGTGFAPLSVRHATRPHFDDGGVIDPTQGSPAGLGIVNVTAPNRMFGQGLGTVHSATNAGPQAPRMPSAQQPQPSGLGIESGSPMAAAPVTPAMVSNAQPGSGGQGFQPNPDNKWLGLMAAGLGMMGSSRADALGAVGQGGLEGLKMYTGLNAQDRQNWMAGQELGLKKEDVDARVKQLDLQSQMIQRQMQTGMDVGNMLSGQSGQSASAAASSAPASAGATATATPGGSAPNPTLISGQPAAPPASGQSGGSAPALRQDMQPGYLYDQAGRLQAAAARAYQGGQTQMGDSLLAQASSFRQRADTLFATGKTMTADGRTIVAPGADQAAAQTASAVAGAEAAAKAPYETMEVQDPTDPGGPKLIVPKSQVLNAANGQGSPSLGNPGPGSPPGAGSAAMAPFAAGKQSFIQKSQDEMAADDKTMRDQYGTRQVVLQRIDALGKIILNYQPGSFAEQKADAVAALRGIGINAPASVTSDPAKFQEFVKNAYANVMDQANAMHGRILDKEVQAFTKSNPSPELQPEANAAIIAQQKGILNYENQYTRDYMNWRAQHPTAWGPQAAQFDIAWRDRNKVQDFVNSAAKDIAYKGQPLPKSPADAVDGQLYMTQQGPLRWNAAKGKFYPDQAAQ